MKLSRIEQETIVLYNAKEQIAEIYTRDRAVMRKLDTLVTEFPNIYKCIRATDIDKTYQMPKSNVNFRKPRKVSEAQRDSARRMMQIINKS